MKPGMVLALAAVVSCATPRDASQAQRSSSSQAQEPPARAAAPPLPASEGSLAFAAAGCAKLSGEEGGARHPPPPRTRRAALVTVRPLAGGVAITHEVTHACCLGASATSRVEGRTVVVTERLSGTPCRCLCASTLRSAVRLPAGSWTVELELDTNGAVKRVGSNDVEIR